MGTVKEKYEGKFTGTSEDGDFQEALEYAIEAAQGSSSKELVKWRLDNVTGEKGGITGANILKVTIQKLDPETSNS
jgi:hypothetical protein